MRDFSSLVGLLVLTAATTIPAGLASAGDIGRPFAPAEARPVLICSTDVATRRAFIREHGSAPIFVTAREVMSVRTTDPAWSTPRCMTVREHARYRDAAITYAAVR